MEKVIGSLEKVNYETVVGQKGNEEEAMMTSEAVGCAVVLERIGNW
jgi:hypothetical protein